MLGERQKEDARGSMKMKFMTCIHNKISVLVLLFDSWPHQSSVMESLLAQGSLWVRPYMVSRIEPVQPVTCKTSRIFTALLLQPTITSSSNKQMNKTNNKQKNIMY